MTIPQGQTINPDPDSRATQAAEPSPETATLQSRVSVVIPCYNHAHFLPQAIASVHAQTVRPTEIIVVDDGSADDTATVAQAIRDVIYIWQHNAGLSAARNAGMTRATGDYVIFLDADDILLPDAIERGLACFADHPQSAFVFGGHVGTDVAGNVLWETRTDPRKADYAGLLGANVIGMHAAVLYRRDVLDKIGGFDTALPSCEDYDVYLRLAAQHPISCHDGVIAQYRQHGANMSHNAARMLATVLAVINGQQARANADPVTRAAYRQGLRYYQDYYGSPLIIEAARHLSRGEFRQSAAKLAAVRRLAPRALLGAPRNLARVALRSTRPGT